MPSGQAEQTNAAPARPRHVGRYGSVSLILGGSGAAIAMLVVIAAAFLVAEARRDSVNQWRNTLVQFARVLAGHADQALRAADLVIVSARDDVSQMSGGDAEHLKRMRDDRELANRLTEIAATSGNVGAIAVYDRDGRLLGASGSDVPPSELTEGVDVRAALAAPYDSFFVGDAAVSKITGKWRVPLARPLFDHDGSVMGAISVTMRDQFFTDFYKNLDLAATVTLARQDGVVLAQYPQRENIVGKSLGPSTAFKRFREFGPGAWEVTEPRILADNEVSTRIVAAQGAATYPVIVFATTLDGVYLSRWQSMVEIIGIGAAAGCALVLGFTYVVVQLQSAQRQLAAELEAGMVAAEAASRAKSDFVAIMSHEVRNPLNVVFGMAELLRLSRLNAEQRRHVEAIQSTSKGLVALLSDVMSLSRLEVGRSEVKRVPVLLGRLVERTVEQGRILVKGRPIEVVGEVAPDLPESIVGDPDRLQQVLLNLVGNAVKFTPSGRVTVRARLADCRPGAPPALRLEVQDTGPGVEPELRDRLFEPYVQGSGDATARAAGFGLGLTISRSIVSLLGGEIGLTASAEPGALFFIEVPFSPADARPAAPAEPAGDPPASPAPEGALRVLVAEDEPLNRSLVQMLLQRLGHEAVLVENGAQAVARVEEQPPFDAILLDIQMPVMDGLAAARRIRGLGGPRGAARLVAMTAQVGKPELQRAAQVGFDDVLAKPFALTELQALLDPATPKGAYLRTLAEGDAA